MSENITTQGNTTVASVSGAVSGGSGVSGIPVSPSETQVAVTQSSGGTSDWTTSLNDDVKGYVQAKGFKDPASVIDSYRNLEKLMGVPKERLLKLPEKADAPEWGEVYNRLGRPSKPEEYTLKKHELLDGKMEEFSRKAFHELGLNRTQAEKFYEKLGEFVGSSEKQTQEQYQTKATQEVEALKQEWGAAYEKNTEMAKRAAKEFGVTGDQIDQLEIAMGLSGMLKFMQQVGSKLGEDAFVGSGQTSAGAKNFGVLTPEQARHQISELKADKDFVSRYVRGDSDARQKMENLHKMSLGY